MKKNIKKVMKKMCIASLLISTIFSPVITTYSLAGGK